MSLSDPSPKLPRWIFFLTDAVLVAAAVFLALESRRPLAPGVVYTIAGCVFIGALIGLVPLVAAYEREKNESLAERQNALDALSRTVAASAEQISIAANGLHEIVELAHRNLRQAEQLPHKLQEKIAEFQARLDNARDDEREELEKELAELRAGETDQLGAAAEKVHAAVAELARAESAAQKQLAAIREAIADTPGKVDAALENAAATAVRRVSDAGTAAANALDDAARRSAEALRQAIADADASLAARIAASVAALESAAPPAPPIVTAPSAHATTSLESDGAPTRRPRKPRREEPASESATTSVPLADVPASSPSAPVASDAPTPAAIEPTEPAAAPTPSEIHPEPAPVPSEQIPRVEPVVPRSAHPFTNEENTVSAPEAPAPQEPVVTPAPAPDPLPAPAVAPEPDSMPAAPTAATAAAAHFPAVSVEATEPPPAEPPKPPRKRSPRKTGIAEPGLALPLEGGDFAQPAPDEAPATASEVIERVISSDGATRLLVTAYIGIGNRLFIRGSGPGLSWETGVPLQFVSIGKWRWETPDATEPVQFKLYKNDDVECAALGTMTLEPGHQQEVAARF